MHGMNLASPYLQLFMREDLQNFAGSSQYSRRLETTETERISQQF
jgi:hypothetical protein